MCSARASSFEVSVQNVYSSTLVPTKTPEQEKISHSRAPGVPLDDPPTQSWWKHKQRFGGRGRSGKGFVSFSILKTKVRKKRKKRTTGCLVAAGSTDDACPNHRTLILRELKFCVLLQAPYPLTFIFMIYSQLFQISPGLCL